MRLTGYQGMMLRNTASLRGRVGFLVGTATAAALVMIAAIAVLESVNSQASARIQDTQRLRLQLDAMELGMINQESGLHGYALTGDPQFLESYQLGVSQVRRAEAALDRASLDTGSRAKLARLEATAGAWEAWALARKAAIALGPASDQMPAGQGKRLFDDYRAADSALVGQLDQLAQQETAEARRSSSIIAVATPLLSALILVLLLMLGALSFRSILAPIGHLAAVAGAVARGETVVIPAPKRRDELGRLAEALSAWQQESTNRLGLAQAMVDVNSNLNLDEGLELGIQRAREVLDADEVVVLLARDGRFEVTASGGRTPVDSITAWIEMAAAMQTALTASTTLSDYRDEIWQTPTRSWAHAHGVGPVLSVPMVSRSVTVGALCATRLAGRPAFVEADAQVAQIIAGPLAAAVHVAKVFGEKESQAKTLAILNETARAASGVLDPVPLARVVVDKASELLGGHYATLSWYEPEDGLLHILAENHPRPVMGAHRPGQGAAGKAFQTGEPVVVDDYQTWPDAVRSGAARGIRGMLTVPLLANDRPVGALSVHTKTVHHFTRPDVQLLSLLAAEVAPALQAARLHMQLAGANEELTKVSRHKSQFLANMSHELRTPLNAILGFSELLMDEGGQALDSRKRLSYLGHIHSSGKHLLGLINEVLDLAKIEAGQVELHPVLFHLGATIEAAIETVEPIAHQKGIAISQENNWSGTLVADEPKVRQILLNLLSNAIKFTPPGGRITLGTHAEEGMVVLSVTDTGIGIASEDQERVFDEFEQLDSGRQAGHPGTGLGLALSRRLAEVHGGRVWVESEPGRGSRFQVALPLDETVAEGGEGAESPSLEGSPLVLVVEDNLSAAALLSSTLRRGGYRTEVVRDGREAMEKARHLRPLAITLDILLPGLDGWEVLRALKSSEETRDIPVLVVSVVDNRSLGIALGADDFLVKPLDRQALLTALARHVGRPPAQQQVSVLVVDDEQEVLDRLAEQLRPGFKVIKARGGGRGLELARSEHPDLVLVELVMEEVTGFDVVAILQADPSTRDIPILAMTARDLTEIDKSRLNGRVEAVLVKGQEGASQLLGRLELLKERLTIRTDPSRAATHSRS